MKTTALIRTSAVLFGLVALAATSVHAQGPPTGVGMSDWGNGGSSGNPYSSNPNSNNDDNSNNSNNSSNDNGSTDGGGGGDGDGDSDGDSSSNTGSSSSTNGNGNVNGNNGDDNGSFGGSTTTSGNGGFSPSFGSVPGFPTGDFDISSVMNFPVAHGALAAIAFGFLFPLGAILMRVVPGRGSLFSHGFIQVLAYALYIAAAGLGLYLVNIMRIRPGEGLLDIAGKNAHPIIGIVLLVVLFFQPIFGIVHHSRFKVLKRRTWISHVHLWAGRFGITLGIINGGLGFALAGTTGTPVVIYAIVSGIIWVIWVLTALRGEYARARTQGRERKKEKLIQEDRGYVPGVRGGGGDSTRPSSENAADNPGAYPPHPPDASMDIPSPPYEPGPHYEAHMAHVHQQPARREVPNMKEVMDRSDTVSYLSASHDEMNRGQV
ncbi:hypothetical protein GQX73_g4303 [Xylaria multiplex]|uniref:Cytochrome b561 domain-containing protein n=1 Tax=Xylaria multiplex TaxID=323545 RepID=A0A7C8MN17_9PEZI|nr:hypothetical protein GQX73_g4303 [Xylaria multiplex]